MSKINWLTVLGWKMDQLDEIRNAGYAYIRQGKYNIALPLFSALVVLDRTNTYDSQTLGALYLEMGNAAEAHKHLERALQMDADHAPTLLNLAKALIMLNKQPEAIKLASVLKNDKNKQVSNVAKALLLAYGE
jgi:tetratricopeptide (TPR) repeat protein